MRNFILPLNPLRHCVIIVMYLSSCKLQVLQTPHNGNPWWKWPPNPADNTQTFHVLWLCPRRSSSHLRPQRPCWWSGPDSGRNSARWCPGTPEGCPRTYASGSDEHKSDSTKHNGLVTLMTDETTAGVKGSHAQLDSPQSFLQVPDSEPSHPSTDSPCSQYAGPLSKQHKTKLWA